MNQQVSILVLVDAALRLCFCLLMDSILAVSILVLVDAALRHWRRGSFKSLQKVSILVLVDAALRRNNTVFWIRGD